MDERPDQEIDVKDVKTLDDIARLSGFSRSTVSRALTGDSMVKASTRERILAVANKYRFTGNAIARGMVKGKMPIVMVIAGDYSNYFYGATVSSIERILFDKGYLVALCTSDYSARKELAYLKMSAMFKVSAVVLMSAVETDELADEINRLDCPVISVNRRLNKSRVDMVVQANMESAYLATDHLIRMGHRNVACLAGIRGASTSVERSAGFFKALSDHGIPAKPEVVKYGELTYESGYNFANRLISDGMPYTAVFVANDMMAVGFVKAMQNAGFHVPKDISIICFDHSPYLEQLSVQVSTVGCSAAELATKTAELLIGRLANPDGKKRTIVLPPSIEVKKSVRRTNARRDKE